MVLLHTLPKKHLNLNINEHGDIFEGSSKHLGELNMFCENDYSLIGMTGPTGPTTKGNIGPRGHVGNTGPTGFIGQCITGPTGDTGIDGIIGYIGPVGIKGRHGECGPTGIRGHTGNVRYSLPRPYLSGVIHKPFIFDSTTYPILPWKNISNNQFTLSNNIVTFPKKYGIYKIEVGFQLNTCVNQDMILIELIFNSKCKKYTHLTPNYKRHHQRHSSCSTLHIIYPVEQDTSMTIQISAGQSIAFENAYISIHEIY